jgi:ribosomal protein S18 acetylase RimI-like enzyme
MQPVIQFRTFRNTDPPGLVRVWNDALAGRGTVPLRSASLLEYFLLCKSYFDPDGLHAALDGTQIVGWALTGFGPDATHMKLDLSTGVVCLLGVLPDYRGKGIGTELLKRSEDYLRRCGAGVILAGPMPPQNPFTFGLYGGSQSPGFLESNSTIGPFLQRRGYEVSDTVLVMHRQLERPFNVIDGRFPALRKKFDVKTQPRRGPTPWYDECVRGPLDFLSFQVEERGSGLAVGQARIWEMEPFSLRWNESAVGLVDVSVEEPVRRQGVARLLLGNVMRFLHDQYFTLVEAQVCPDNAAALGLFRGLGFKQIDTGRRYRRKA